MHFFSSFIILTAGFVWIVSSFAQEESFSSDKSLEVSLHKENYLIPYYNNLKKVYDATDDEELKFQLSLKVSLLQLGTSFLAVAYTQKAHWQIYDEEESRPFRETNYNPEIFFRSGNGFNYIDLGFEHESNGREEPQSRSWDRVFLRGQYSSRSFKVGLKWWSIVESEDYSDSHPEREESLKSFYGNTELELGLLINGTMLKSLSRYNPDTYKGFVEAKLLWRLAGQLYWGAFYSKGYGDSLRSYDIDNESVGIGILTNP